MVPSGGSGIGVLVAVARTTKPSAGSGVIVAVGGTGVRVGRGVSVIKGVEVGVTVADTWSVTGGHCTTADDTAECESGIACVASV